MKKYLFSLITIISCLCIIGCGSKEKASNNSNSKKEKDGNITIKYNEESKIDNLSVKVVEVNLLSDVVPKSPKGYYHHYEAASGKAYLDVILKIKNDSKNSININDLFESKVVINDNAYSGFSVLELDDRTDFKSYGSIDSLSEEYVHYIFEVPDKTSTDDKISINLTLDGKIYTIDGTSSIENTKTTIEESTIKISNKQKQVVDKVAEFYIEKSSIAKRINPPKASGYYTYYEAKGKKAYVDVIISYKNLNTVDVRCDELLGGVKLIYANNYEYEGYSIVEEDNRSDFTYSNITSISPLTTEYVHYLFEIPEEVKNSKDSLILQFSIEDNLYQYKVR